MMGDEVMTVAMLDRLLHHSKVFNLSGESFRIQKKRGGLSHFFLSGRCKIVFRARCISTCHLHKITNRTVMPFWGLDVEIVLANKSGEQKIKKRRGRGGRRR